MACSFSTQPERISWIGAHRPGYVRLAIDLLLVGLCRAGWHDRGRGRACGCRGRLPPCLWPWTRHMQEFQCHGCLRIGAFWSWPRQHARSARHGAGCVAICRRCAHGRGRCLPIPPDQRRRSQRGVPLSTCHSPPFLRTRNSSRACHAPAFPSPLSRHAATTSAAASRLFHYAWRSVSPATRLRE